MLTIQNQCIYYMNRPLVSLDGNKRIISAGCGTTHLLRSSKGKLKKKDFIKKKHFIPQSYWVTDDEAKIVLQEDKNLFLNTFFRYFRRSTQYNSRNRKKEKYQKTSHYNGSVILQISILHGVCSIRIVGLPWDFNRFEICLLQSEKDSISGKLNKRVMYYWATKENMNPCNGFLTSDGFNLRVDTYSLTGYHFVKPLQTWIEIWDVNAAIVLNQHDDLSGVNKTVAYHHNDAVQVINAIRVDANDSQPLSINGKVVEYNFTEEKSTIKPIILIEDWQGMRETLLGKNIVCSWHPDISRYPNVADLAAKIKNKGFYCAGNLLPLVLCQSDLYREASVRGFLLMNKKGTEYIDKGQDDEACWIDLTNSRGVEWIEKVISDTVIRFGFSALHAEMEEPYPIQAICSGGSALQMRNQWASLWLQVCRNALKNKPEVWVW